MCTVTVVPTAEGARVACNRDELFSRPTALPPRIKQFGERRALLPVDPTSGGTWIAVNDAGLAMSLLNVNGYGGRTTVAAPISRGVIIPSLLHCDSPLAAAFTAVAFDPKQYAPFRLILLNRSEGVEVHSDGVHIRLSWRVGLTSPKLFTSSGLGDLFVEGPRSRLFNEFFDAEGDLGAQQDAFHRHRWEDRPHLSVCMDRMDAQTVSHTVVSISHDWVTLRYHPAAPDRAAEGMILALPISMRSVAC